MNDILTVKEKIEKVLKQYSSKKLNCIGINLYDSGDWYSKAYFSLPIEISSMKAFNHNEAFEIFQEFKKNDFIDYFERVYTEDKNELKLNFLLKKQDKISTEKILNIIRSYINIKNDELKEILNLAKMKVSDSKNRKYEALYYINLTFDLKKVKNSIKRLACYYMIRFEPVGPVVVTPEKYYKEYIVSSNKFFLKLVKDYYIISEIEAGAFYIAALDFYSDGKRTYKLYFKIKDNVLLFKKLKELFKFNNFFLKKICEIENYLIFNKEKLNLIFLAFCINNKNEQSLNFYFVKKKNRS